MKFIKLISIIGQLIPLVFVLSYAFLFNAHPVATETINELSIFGYNIGGIPFQFWIKWINYFLNGLLIQIFSIGLIIFNSQSFTNNLGLVFIFFSGLLWSLLCFFTSDSLTETISDYVILVTLVIPFISSLGLVLISFEIHKLVHMRFRNKLLMYLGTIMFFSMIIGFIFTDVEFTIASIISSLCVSMYGIIGYYLSIENEIV